MMEKYLVGHCAPTLASLKTANLFSYFWETKEQLFGQLRQMNEKLNRKGIRLTILRMSNHRALIYVYREDRLQKILECPQAAGFLAGYGYEDLDVQQAIERLRMRLEGCEVFPHEIGVFLDYPLGDVIGFIENEGQNYKCSGCWKVYCNECETLKTFARYKKCREIYTRLWKQGRDISLLAVSA